MKKWLRIILLFSFIVLIPLLISIPTQRYWSKFPAFSMDFNKASQYILSFGIWAMFAFIISAATTIVVPPIPNMFVAIIGGMLFGMIKGIIYSFIGFTIGLTINFYLTRILGRPFLEKFSSRAEIAKVDEISKKIGWRIIFILQLIPGAYADVAGYAAGLSGMSWSVFISASIAGIALPTIFSVFAGDILSRAGFLARAIIFIAIIGLVAFPLITPLLRKFKPKI